METLFKEKLSCLQADGKKKFIYNALKLYFQKKNIKIGYIALYIYKKKEMTKKC